MIYERNNINEVLTEFENFYQFTGLKINLHKSVILPIGNLQNTRPAFDLPLQWTNQPIKILGIMIHPNSIITQEANFSPLLQRIHDIITMWRYRTLSIIRKVQIVNSLIVSLVMFRLSCLPTPPSSFFDDYYQIRIFMWNGKTSKIRYDKLIQSCINGGLKLIDLKTKDTALKGSLVARHQRDERAHPPILYSSKYEVSRFGNVISVQNKFKNYMEPTPFNPKFGLHGPK